MIDFGFSKDSAGAIDVYFVAMAGLVVVIALAAAARYYLVTTLGERVVADLRRDVFAHLSRLDASLLRQRANRRARLSPDRRHDADQGGFRRIGVDRPAQSLHVRRRDRADGLHEPETVGFRARRHSGHRRAAYRFRACGAPSFAARAGHARRSDRLRLGEPRRGAHHAGLWRRGRQQARFAEEIESAYGAARDAAATRSLLIAVAVSLAFCSVVVRALARRARCARGADERRNFCRSSCCSPCSARPRSANCRRCGTKSPAAAGSAGRIAELLAVKPRIVAPTRPALMPSPARGAIEFRRVAFSYPSAPDVRVLDDVSFSIAPGERVAIVGSSGAGKVDDIPAHRALLRCRRGPGPCRWRRCEDGRSKDLRERIAPSAGGCDLWRDGRREHRLWARRDQRVRDQEAARRAAADGFVRELGLGYATKLGERGVTLSGGQRQRLRDCRAISRTAPILLLDEAT